MRNSMRSNRVAMTQTKRSLPYEFANDYICRGRSQKTRNAVQPLKHETHELHGLGCRAHRSMPCWTRSQADRS